MFLWHFLFNRVPDLPEGLTTGREKAYLSFIFATWSHRRDRVAVETYAAAYGTPGGLRAGFACYRAIPETMRQNALRAQTPLRLPVLAIGAEHATANAPVETLRPHAPNLRGALIADCGHFVTEECPEAFNAQILPFFREGPGR